MKDWVLSVIAIGLARYGMNALGWSDRTQVLVIVAGVIVGALIVLGVRANRDHDAEAGPEPGRAQDPV